MLKQVRGVWGCSFLVALPVIALLSSGCGSDSGGDGSSSSSSSGSSGGGGGVGGGSPGGTPLFGIADLVFSPDLSSRTGYVKFTTSLTADTKIDESKTIESSNGSTLFAVEKSGEFFIADGTKGELDKYSVDASAKTNMEGSVAFGAYGVHAFRTPAVPLVSKTKAYLLDDLTFQAFVWDPSTMTISKNVNLADQFHNEDGGKKYWAWPQRSGYITVGNKLYWSFYYWDDPSFTALPRSGMVVVDMDKDTFTVVEHPTCPGLQFSFLGPDGYIYSATATHVAASHYVGTAGVPEPCLVRFSPEKGAWDDTYKYNLNTLTGTKAAGGMVQLKDGLAYIKVLNESLIPSTTKKDSGAAISTAPAWEMEVIDVTKPTMMPTKVNIPAGAAAMYPARTDDHVYLADMNWMKMESTILDATNNPPAAGLVGKGWITFLVRLR